MPTVSEIHVRGSRICKHIKKQIRPVKGNHDLRSKEGGQKPRCNWGWKLMLAKRDVAVWRSCPASWDIQQWTRRLLERISSEGIGSAPLPEGSHELFWGRLRTGHWID